MKPVWHVRLSAAALRDYAGILRWTLEQFGARQAAAYEKTLKTALVQLVRGPDAPGCRRREDIGAGVRLLHVARRGRKGRHLIAFRVSPIDADTIDVLRLLHDSMDLAHHVPANDDELA